MADVETDLLGAPYTRETLRLRPDAEGEVVATLVHRPGRRPRPARPCCTCTASATTSSRPSAADFWVANGYDFYALDLRKYGRSLRPHQTPNYVADLGTYYEELDLAYERVLEKHDHVVFSAHSTGGLTVPLWLHDRRHRAAGVFLNAPWIDMHGDAFTRLMAMPAIHRIGRRQADARGAAQRQRRLRAQPAPRLRRRVGLRPGVEAGALLAGVRRVDPRRPPRAGPDRARPRDRRPGAAGQLGEVRATPQRRRTC